MSVLLMGVHPVTPTPPMRIQQVIEQEYRLPMVVPGSIPYPYPQLPSYPRAFDNLPSPYFTPYHPYYPYYYWW
jgi:hypothetical protein